MLEAGCMQWLTKMKVFAGPEHGSQMGLSYTCTRGSRVYSNYHSCIPYVGDHAWCTVRYGAVLERAFPSGDCVVARNLTLVRPRPTVSVHFRSRERTISSFLCKIYDQPLSRPRHGNTKTIPFGFLRESANVGRQPLFVARCVRSKSYFQAHRIGHE